MKKLANNPFNGRLDYINNDYQIFVNNIKEYEVWYSGDENELLNFFTVAMVDYFNDNVIYSRNERYYFWSISAKEGAQKKVHSGIPNAIITTLVNIVGDPKIEVASNEKLKDFFVNDTNLLKVLKDNQLPYTLVDGDGIVKINLSSDGKIFYTYYKSLDFKPKFIKNRLVEVEFYNYYYKKGKFYKLIEKRSVESGSLEITYRAVEETYSEKTQECYEIEVPVSFIDPTLQDIRINNYDKLLCEFFIFFDNPNYENRGRSIFTGKCGLFDDLDMTLSQASQTVKVSTPVEYYDSEVLEHDKNGKVKLPKIFNRQFIGKYSALNGDGIATNNDNGILTTQPNLNFSQYAAQAINIVSQILNGLMSPATLGIDVGANSSGISQREKEKITIMMRNSIVAEETRHLRSLIAQTLDVLFNFKENDLSQKDISVKYDEFATPTFDEELSVLGSAYSQGQISTQMFVELLYKDKLTREEKELEVARLDAAKLLDYAPITSADNNSVALEKIKENDK